MQWEVAADPRLRERAAGEGGAGGERARRRGGARPRPRRPRGTRRGPRDRRRRPAGGRGRSGGRGGRHLPRGGERPPGAAPPHEGGAASLAESGAARASGRLPPPRHDARAHRVCPQGIRLPADTPDGLAQALYVKHAKSLEEYLKKYEITLSVMQTAAALERIAYEFVLDAAAEGLRYVEVRYSPLLHRPALTLAQAIEAPLAGLKRGEAETGAKVGLIVCGIRTRAPAESLELARAASGYRTGALAAVGLG